MNSAPPQDVKDFLERFCNLYDGVILEVTLKYLDYSKQVKVLASAQDKTDDFSWKDLTIVFNDVQEFFIKEDKSTCQIISSGLQCRVFNGMLYFSFSSNILSLDHIYEYRQSEFYLSALSFHYDIA
jgi:hypothetical protein